MKTAAATIGLSALIVLSSAVYYFSAAPAPQPADTAATAAAETTSPARQKMPLPAPVIRQLAAPLECFRVAGARYEGAFADNFGGAPREGIIAYNTCDKYVTLMDLKVDSTSLAYVSSIMPIRIILSQMKDKTGKAKDRPERIVALTRTGAHCSAEEQERRACLTVALPPGQSAFISVPVRNWFRLRLKDEQPVTGYLPEAVDPAAPPAVKRVPPMPHPQPLYRPK